MVVKMKCITIVLLLSLSFNLTYSQRISIPFYIGGDNNRMILDYTLKGEKIKMLFDTGSSVNLIDINTANKLNILPHSNGREVTMATIGNTIFHSILPDTPYKLESVFSNGWALIDSITKKKILTSGNEVDGMVGIDFSNNHSLLEIDFDDCKLHYWDTLPDYCHNEEQVRKVKIINTDFERETHYSPILATKKSIRCDLIVADSIHLQPYFIIDTGFPGYAMIVAYNSELIDKMISYKKMITNKFGINYPTSHLQIKELEIDSLLTNLPMIDKSAINNEGINYFGNYQLGGLLGIEFLLQYNKILFDLKNDIVYFIKYNKLF